MKIRRFNWARFPELSDQMPELVIVYQDFETWFRVRDALRALWGEYSMGRSPHTAAWKFDLLEHPALMRMAVLDAASADAIVISAHGNSDLPPNVKNWIKQWLDSRTGDGCTLVVLLDAAFEGHPSADEILHYLKDLASPAHLEYSARFCEATDAHVRSHARMNFSE